VRLGLTTLVIGCVMVLAVADMILNVVLGHTRKDSCSYCSASLAQVRIYPHCHTVIENRQGVGSSKNRCQ
jgi:hypothetical protein